MTEPGATDGGATTPTGATDTTPKTPPPLTRDQARRAASHLRDFAASARIVAQGRRVAGDRWMADEHDTTATAYEASAERLEYEGKRDERVGETRDTERRG